MNLPKLYTSLVLTLMGSYSTCLLGQDLINHSAQLPVNTQNHICKISPQTPDSCQSTWELARSTEPQKNIQLIASQKVEKTPFLPATPDSDAASLQALKNNYLNNPQLLIKSLKHRHEVVRSQAVFYALKNPDINADSIIELAIQDNSQRVKAMALETNRMNIAQIKRLENDSDPEIASLARLKATQYAH